MEHKTEQRKGLSEDHHGVTSTFASNFTRDYVDAHFENHVEASPGCCAGKNAIQSSNWLWRVAPLNFISQPFLTIWIAVLRIGFSVYIARRKDIMCETFRRLHSRLQGGERARVAHKVAVIC